ncbi:MAG: glycosyltransferase family 4 protein [Methyloprofundus sp.]|nr:glycosyltransferase family 4 protein [Methyloprofundus sp.]
MKKTLIVQTHLHKNRTGVTSCIEQLIPEIRAKYDVILIGSTIKTEIKLYTLMQGIKFSFNYIKKNGFVIWHVHRNNELLIAIIFRFFMQKTKIIATRHGATKPSWISRFLYAKADEIISLNQEMYATLGLPSKLIPHGISLDCFKNNTIKKEYTSKKKYIGIVGRIRPLKGQLDLVKALIPIFKENADWDCFIVGKYKPDYYLEIVEEIKRSQLNNRFLFTGEVDNIYSYYQFMDINVIASYTEGSSMVPLEAMLCHTAVVATKNVGTNSLLIKPGYNGELYSPGDIENLSEILLDLITNENKVYLYKKRGYETICEKWSADIEANEIMKLYEEITGV